MSDISTKHFVHPPFKLAMRHFSFTLPAKWEVVGYRRDDLNGEFSFNNPDGPVGQFAWKVVKALPNIEDSIVENHRRLMSLEAPPKIRFTRHGQGVVLAHTKNGERFYAAIFNVAERCLNEWVFPSYSPEKAQEVVPMLESYSHNLPGKDGRVDYALFGLELSLGEKWILKEIEPYPGSITLMFENSSRHKIYAHRFGMAELILEGADTSNFYHRFLYNKHYKIRQVVKSEVSGRDGGRVTFATRGKRGFDFVLGAWWRGEGVAFLQESENRIYAFEHIAQSRIKAREDVRDIFRDKLSERK